MIDQLLSTPLTQLTGVRHPVVQTGMGWVAGPSLVSGTANAGGLGILASATMTLAELDKAILEVKERTDQPFGVNLRADAADAPARCRLLVEHGVKVASFALAPKPELIASLKEHDVVVIPSVGLPKHAVKVASWGADAVMIQGGEGGGHTGSVPTTLLLPTVLDAVDIPVIAAGGFFDGRGLAAALSYGAAGVGMGTRFLLTAESRVPDEVKQRYLSAGLDDTVVTKKVDGMPHRMLRTDLVEQVEGSSGVRRLIPTARRTLQFKRMAGMTWKELAIDGRSMRKEQGRTLGQLALAANTPMMLKAGLVEGDPDRWCAGLRTGRRCHRRPPHVRGADRPDRQRSGSLTAAGARLLPLTRDQCSDLRGHRPAGLVGVGTRRVRHERPEDHPTEDGHAGDGRRHRLIRVTTSPQPGEQLRGRGRTREGSFRAGENRVHQRAPVRLPLGQQIEQLGHDLGVGHSARRQAGLPDRGHHLVRFGDQHLLEHVSLGSEVAVHQSVVDPRSGSDVAHGESGRPLLGHQLVRRRQHRSADFFASVGLGRCRGCRHECSLYGT